MQLTNAEKIKHNFNETSTEIHFNNNNDNKLSPIIIINKVQISDADAVQ